LSITCRLGGDEFVVLAEDLDDAKRFADRIVAGLAATVSIPGYTLHAHASISMCSSAAATAMYTAKRRRSGDSATVA
jgi:GGDEF domain-containing protein